MSHAIKFSGPFIRQMFTSAASGGRSASNPLYAVQPNYNEFLPVPHRRVYTLIQNIGTADASLGFSPDNDVTLGGPGVKLYPGQSISLDNYNGPIHVYENSGAEVLITEAFA